MTIIIITDDLNFSYFESNAFSGDDLNHKFSRQVENGSDGRILSIFNLDLIKSE